jgi:hypothetical protein
MNLRAINCNAAAPAWFPKSAAKKSVVADKSRNKFGFASFCLYVRKNDSAGPFIRPPAQGPARLFPQPQQS